MTPCQGKRSDIFEFADGELDPQAEKQVGRHVEDCCDCARLLRSIRAQKSALKRLTPIETRDTFTVLLHERIRREMAGKRGFLFRPALEGRRWIPASALALVLLAAGLWMLDRKTAPRPGSAVSLGSAAAPEQKPVRVHYVMDEIPQTRLASVSPAEPGQNGAAMDTTERVRNFDGLRDRLVPVSF